VLGESGSEAIMDVTEKPSPVGKTLRFRTFYRDTGEVLGSSIEEILLDGTFVVICKSPGLIAAEEERERKRMAQAQREREEEEARCKCPCCDHA
jgi:hypothetical protein